MHFLWPFCKTHKATLMNRYLFWTLLSLMMNLFELCACSGPPSLHNNMAVVPKISLGPWDCSKYLRWEWGDGHYLTQLWSRWGLTPEKKPFFQKGNSLPSRPQPSPVVIFHSHAQRILCILKEELWDTRIMFVRVFCVYTCNSRKPVIPCHAKSWKLRSYCLYGGKGCGITFWVLDLCISRQLKRLIRRSPLWNVLWIEH